jgi:uncharacterized membrane protein YoaT (DUF817 family)
MQRPVTPRNGADHTGWTAVEHRLGLYLKPRLPSFAYEFIAFGLKMAWASLFAGLMLALLILTKLIWQPQWALARYDVLLAAAISIQLLLLALKLETPKEALVILIYHAVGTLMEIFKTKMGSWTYPEANIFRIGGVPLFTGFMYATVGSFMVRAIRLFDMRFVPYPPFWTTALLALAIYTNFFMHHYVLDIRYLLFAATLALYARTMIHFRPADRTFRMPLVIAASLTALFLWLAENVGTLTGTWIYPGQKGWQLVSLGKLGSWYLLLYLSFVLVTLVHRPRPAATEDLPHQNASTLPT